MVSPPVDRAPQLEWGVASIALPGETTSGDLHIVQAFPGGALMGVVDGLGHGAEAALAARRAVAELAQHAGESPIGLVQRSHQALAGTRGVVMSVASYNARDHTLTWIGVGNVEGFLVRSDPGARPARESILLRGGVVGHDLPQLRATVMPVAPEDTLIFVTDGIRPDFLDELNLAEAPQPLADLILRQSAKRTDDGLVLVVRVRPK